MRLEPKLVSYLKTSTVYFTLISGRLDRTNGLRVAFFQEQWRRLNCDWHCSSGLIRLCRVSGQRHHTLKNKFVKVISRVCPINHLGVFSTWVRVGFLCWVLLLTKPTLPVWTNHTGVYKLLMRHGNRNRSCLVTRKELYTVFRVPWKVLGRKVKKRVMTTLSSTI